MDLLFVPPKTEHRKTVVDFVRAFDEHGQPLFMVLMSASV